MLDSFGQDVRLQDKKVKNIENQRKIGYSYKKRVCCAGYPPTVKLLLFTKIVINCRDAYAGGQEGQLPPLPSFMGAGGARIALLTELLHLSYLLKRHFPAL